MRIKLILISVIFLVSGCGDRTVYRDTQILMGTTVEVVSGDRQASRIVFEEIQRIDNLLSKYKDDSEVALLNKKGELPVSPETFYVIKKSKEFWQLSGGAFDVTVAPLMDLWGFTQRSYRIPSDDEIKEALRYAGSDKIIFNDKNNMVKFKVLGVKIDLGAIGKGFAVDCAVKKLKERGIKSCLVNAGGHIYCLGDRSGRPWKIAIQDPRKLGFAGYVKLKDRAIATSGDYRQFFIEGNRRYAHIIDPRTGYPADSGVISATVIAPDCTTADAIATAVFVLGEGKGREFAKNFKEVELTVIAK